MEYIIIYYIYRWNHGILPWSIYRSIGPGRIDWTQCASRFAAAKSEIHRKFLRESGDIFGKMLEKHEIITVQQDIKT